MVCPSIFSQILFGPLSRPCNQPSGIPCLRSCARPECFQTIFCRTGRPNAKCAAQSSCEEDCHEFTLDDGTQCWGNRENKQCAIKSPGAMSTFYLSASFSLRKHPRLLFLHAPRDPFCICSRLSGSNLCDVCVCTYVCVYTCASGTLCLSVFSIHLRVNAAFYHPALTVESTTGCSSAADCDCPTEGGWWPGWCDQGNCWYVRPSYLEFSFPLSLVRATVTRYPLFEIMR